MSKEFNGSKAPGKSGLTRNFLPRATHVAGALLVTLSIQSPKAQAAPFKQDIETRVWTSDLSDIAQLEKAAVRLLQERPGAYEHYVVAELSLRQFKHNPAELRFLKQASDLSQQAIELAPTKEYGYLVSSQVLELMGYKDEAVEMLKGNPTFKAGWRTAFVRGVVAAEQPTDKDVFASFKTALTYPDASRELIGTYVASHAEANYSGAELVKVLESWKLDTLAMDKTLAHAYDDAGNSEEAHKLYASLEAKAPSYGIELADAILLYSKLGKMKEAEKLLKEVAQRSPDNDEISAAKAHLGAISLAKNDFKGAAENFTAAATTSSERLKWLSFMHKNYSERNRLAEFASLLQDLREPLSGVSFLYALQGEVLSESLAQHGKAIESFAAAITLDPNRSEFYNGMGLAYYRLHDNEKALSTFNKALAIDPSDATARYNEACVLAIMGRGDEAVGSLKKAILLDGRLQMVALKDKDFEGIRTNAQFQSLVEPAPSVTKEP